MQNLIKAAQQALDALEMGCTDHDGNPVDLVGPAITALRAALAEDYSADTGKTSDHFSSATKMMTTIRSEVKVDVVQSSHIKELYSVDEIREKIESNAYCAELLLQHAMLHLMGNVKPKRKQLSNAEIGSVAADIWGSMLIAPQSYQQFARAIERAHGIGE